MRSNMLQTYVCVSECERVCEGWKGAGGGGGGGCSGPMRGERGAMKDLVPLDALLCR